MRSFYIRFVHRAYATNVRLKNMKVLNLDVCCFCKEVTETRIHLFWECPRIKVVWDQVIQFCKENVSDSQEYNMANCLLLGFEIPVLNMIMLACKYVIHIS